MRSRGWSLKYAEGEPHQNPLRLLLRLPTPIYNSIDRRVRELEVRQDFSDKRDTHRDLNQHSYDQRHHVPYYRRHGNPHDNTHGDQAIEIPTITTSIVTIVMKTDMKGHMYLNTAIKIIPRRYHHQANRYKLQKSQLFPVVEVMYGDVKWILVSIYMPSRGSKQRNTIFEEVCFELTALFLKYSSTHNVVVGGDWNATILAQRDNRDTIFQKFIAECGLSVSGYSDNVKTFNHPNERDSSQIDYFLSHVVSSTSHPSVSVLMDAENTSDHCAITFSTTFPNVMQTGQKTT